MNGSKFLALITLAVTVAACSDANAGHPARVSGGAPSLETLAAEALRAFESGDTATLARLRLTETEHNTIIWPELPAAAAEAAFPVDLAWENLELRNREALVRRAARPAARKRMFDGVQCHGETRRFETFRVLTDCDVVAADSDGSIARMRLFKDVAVVDGRHKVFRWYAD